jgi:hypothetical protein
MPVTAHAKVAHCKRGTGRSAIGVAVEESHLDDDKPHVIQVAGGVESAVIKVLSGAVMEEDVGEHRLGAVRLCSGRVSRVATGCVVRSQFVGHFLLPALLRPGTECLTHCTTTSVDESLGRHIAMVQGNSTQRQQDGGYRTSTIRKHTQAQWSAKDPSR